MTKRSAISALALLLSLAAITLTVGPRRLVAGLEQRWFEDELIGRCALATLPGRRLTRAQRDIRLRIVDVEATVGGGLCMRVAIENHTPTAALFATRRGFSEHAAATPLLVWRRPTQFGVTEPTALTPAAFYRPMPLLTIEPGARKTVQIELSRELTGPACLPPIVDASRPGCSTLRAVLLLKSRAGRGSSYILSDAVRVCVG